MNNLMVAFFAGLIAISNPSIAEEKPAAKEIKTICHPAKDKKGNVLKDKKGKEIQNCKKVKIHKKFEGTKVPEKKK